MYSHLNASDVHLFPPKGSASSSLENVESLIEPLPSAEYEILWKIETGGHYLGTVLYEGQAIGVPNFEVICLNGTRTCCVSHVCYVAVYMYVGMFVCGMCVCVPVTS